MRLGLLGLVAAFGLTGCCSFCEKHCEQCRQPAPPPPGYAPVGYYAPPAAAACYAPINPCAYPGAVPTTARSAPAANCACPP